MTAHALSASKYELAQRCPGAFALPWRDEPNEYSDAGTESHAEDEQAISQGDIPEAYAERWPGYRWRAEVSYAYDVSTGVARYLGQGLKRAYGQLAPFERPGTVDAEGWLDGHLVIVDRKQFEEQTAAAQHPQLRFLALAAFTVHRPRRVTVAISHQLYGLDVAEMDAFDLDVIPHQIREVEFAVARARSDARDGRPVPFNTGRHCRWCPAFAACPRQQELKALTMREDDDPELALSTTLIDPEDAPDVYALWKRIGILHKRIGQTLYAYASNNPIPVGNGKMFGSYTNFGNDKLNGDVVYEVVRELHGQESADAAVIRSATKKRLGETLKGKRGAAKAVLTEVSKRGGISRATKPTIGEYDPALRLVDGGDE